MRKIESLREHRPRDPIELPRGCQVASERLFDNNARIRGQVCGTESLDHHLKERGRDSEVVRRAPGFAQSALYRSERLRIRIIPAHVLEQGKQMMEGWLVVDPARPFYAFGHALVQTSQAPIREGHADHRDLKGAALHHRVKRRKDHLVREITVTPKSTSASEWEAFISHLLLLAAVPS